MTESRQYVRVLLYGCAHRPKFSAMSVPKKDDWMTCYACRTARQVVGIETGWRQARAKCKICKWMAASDNMTRKKMRALSQHHANAMEHRVGIEKDGYEELVSPQGFRQQPLIDDLLLPD